MRISNRRRPLKRIQCNWIRIKKKQWRLPMQRTEKINFAKSWSFRCTTVRNVLQSYCRSGWIIPKTRNRHRVRSLKNRGAVFDQIIKWPRQNLWVESCSNCWMYRRQNLQKLEIRGHIKQRRLWNWLKRRMERCCLHLSRLLPRKDKELNWYKKVIARNQIRVWLIRNRRTRNWSAVKLNHHRRMLLGKQRIQHQMVNPLEMMQKIIWL